MFNINLKYFIVLFLFGLMLINPLKAQQWVKTYNGNSNGDDIVIAMTTDKAGNIYVTGFSTLNNSGIDMFTQKYSSAGSVLWTRYYNGPANGEDKAFGIVVDNSGNVYITGYSAGVGSNMDITTIKYNSSGSQLWVQRYNEPGNGDDRGFGIVVDRAGNVYVTGYIARIATDTYLIKYNTNGVYLWGQLISGTANQEDKAFGIVVDETGDNIFITGYLTNDTTGSDIFVANYDSTGNRRWLRNYSSPGENDDRAFGIVVDTDENIIVSGYETDTLEGNNYVTLKYNFSGDMLWASRYNGPGNSSDKAFGIVVDSHGNSYVTGYSMNADSNTDYLTVKINPGGDTMWTARYNGPENNEDTAYGICLGKNDSSIYVTGGSFSDTAVGKLDILSVKYRISNGEELQTSRYDGPAHKNDKGLKIVSDTSGNVYIGGITETASNGYDFILMKYLNGELIAVEQISSVVPEEFRLYQNYPNPFNPSTKIIFDLKKSAPVKLAVYDVLGRLVAVPVDELLKTGTYEVTFNAELLASGIYFYELASGDFRETKKMILLK